MQKKIFHILLIAMVIFSSCRPAGADSWNFAVMSDTQDSSGGSGVSVDAFTAVASDIVNNQNCEFVLVVGDLVNGESGTDPDDLVDQYVTFNNAATLTGLTLTGSGGSGLTYYPVRGNHETYNTITGVDTAEAWKDAFPTLPQNGPDSAPGGGGNSEIGLTYSFTHENALFFAIDEYINIATIRVNQEWLDEQLAGSTAQHIFAFGHEPAYQVGHFACLAGNQTERDAFLTSLYDAGGRFYFCGHDHVVAFGRVYEKDPGSGGTQGFYQLVDGSSGGSLRTFDGVYNTNYPTDHSVTDLYHDGDPTTHYTYVVVTIDDDLLWLRTYGTESLTPVDWGLLHSMVISGTLTSDTSTLTGNITNEATINFNQNSDGTYSDVINGLGDLTKSGSAILTLSGTNTYTGGTTVNAGTLNISGSCSSSAVTVNSGGILKGTGTVGSLANYGIVRPGNSVGTLNLNGDTLTQDSSGTLEIEVESTVSYDKIIGASTATLDGKLKTITSGSYDIGDTLSGVIQTSGGITGTFSYLDTQITPTIVWKPQENGNDLDLVATRDYNNDALVTTLTFNQKNVAALMQKALPSATGDLATVKSIIDNLSTNAEVADAYSQISPEKYSGVSSLAFSNASVQFSNLQSQMYTLRTGVSRGIAFDSRKGVFYGDLFNSDNTLIAYDGDDWGKFVHKNEVQTKKEKKLRFFINGRGIFGDQDSIDNQPGFDFSAGGVTTGWDYRIMKNLVTGFDAGYTRAASDLHGSGGEVTVDSVYGGIYGTYYIKDFYINGASDFCYNFYDTERNIKIGGLNRKAKGDTSGKQWDLFLDTGYDFHVGRLTAGPTAIMKYSKLWIDDFSETNAGALNLDISDQSAESFRLGIGWRVEHELKAGKQVVVPRAHISYQYEFSNDSRSIEARLAQGGGIFQIETYEPVKNFILTGCGIALKLTESASLDVGYEAEIGESEYVAHSIDGSISVFF